MNVSSSIPSTPCSRTRSPADWTRILPEGDWRRRQATHRAQLFPWVDAHRDRQRRGEAHPVFDFLFSYYSFRPSRLMCWSPGVGIGLAGEGEEAFARLPMVVAREGVVGLDPARFPAHRRAAAITVREALERVAARAPSFGCAGLHEWAMLYRADARRHASYPLRVSRRVIADTVEQWPLRCTHFDAYRFFTAPARPLNELPLSRDRQFDHEQPGCLHATMDLYKWAYKFWPWIGSDLVAAAFRLAISAREIDMRASPYDLTALGYAPIAVETAVGRAEYQRCQAALAARATPLRARLLAAYGELLAAIGCPTQKQNRPVTEATGRHVNDERLI